MIPNHAEPIPAVYAASGVSITLPTPTLLGYTFRGYCRITDGAKCAELTSAGANLQIDSASVALILSWKAKAPQRSQQFSISTRQRLRSVVLLR
ncbi:MAG: hypothetical protein LBP35_01090 [Candidatus Ancillula trichonymphae]|nr:hypothetical protein [Candidatus Ancillula trichonymphae]